MTLQQEVCEKIMGLPDDSVRLVLSFVNGIISPLHTSDQNELAKKRRSYEAMMEMKKASKYPRDFDYNKAREEAIFEKYGRIERID